MFIRFCNYLNVYQNVFINLKIINDNNPEGLPKLLDFDDEQKMKLKNKQKLQIFYVNSMCLIK